MRSKRAGEEAVLAEGGPLNAIIIARNILTGLQRVSPADAAYFSDREKDFEKRLLEATMGTDLVGILNGIDTQGAVQSLSGANVLSADLILGAARPGADNVNRLFGVGAASGVCNGAVAMGGLPVAIFLTADGDSPKAIRAAVDSLEAGDVLVVEFTVLGIPCIGLNGGPAFKQSEAFSFQIATDSQEETDRYWNAIVGNGGQESACGWCKDRWGVSWQITPRVLTEALAVKRVAALDVLKEGNDTASAGEEERFESDFQLMAGELAQLLDDLVNALGGEQIEQAA